MEPLKRQTLYAIALCSGETRLWQYLGPDAHQQVWWQDQETGTTFPESRLMYAWQVIGPANQAPDGTS